VSIPIYLYPCKKTGENKTTSQVKSKNQKPEGKSQEPSEEPSEAKTKPKKQKPKAKSQGPSETKTRKPKPPGQTPKTK
jgi:hypothetical protein